MKMTATRACALTAVALMVVGTAACGGTEADANTLTLWDGYTQYDEDSPWGKMLSTCADSTGVTLDRTADQKSADTLLQSATTGNLPDLTVLEYSYVPQFAKAGLLVDNGTSGLDASAQMENVVESGDYEGKTYGASLGFNTLALYYNPDLLAEAGIDAPPTNWDELREYARQLTSGDQKGFGFAAIAGEDGTHQFLPFFWGAGAELDDVDSPESVEAFSYIQSLIEDGSVSTDIVNWNQQDLRDQFMAGNVAMMLNGTWQLNDLDAAGTSYEVVPFPGKDGGQAPVPLGGEFIELVNTGNEERMRKAAEFAQCLISPDGMKDWAAGQTYLIPTEEGAAQQAQDDPRLAAWVDIAASSKSKVADLGADYPSASLALQTAFQSVLSGRSTPEDAAATAQQEIEAARE